MKQKQILFLIADSIGLQVVASIIIEQSSYTLVFQYLRNVRSTRFHSWNIFACASRYNAVYCMQYNALNSL
jgi:hypothetical protein